MANLEDPVNQMAGVNVIVGQLTNEVTLLRHMLFDTRNHGIKVSMHVLYDPLFMSSHPQRRGTLSPGMVVHTTMELFYISMLIITSKTLLHA